MIIHQANYESNDTVCGFRQVSESASKDVVRT